ncbi:alpha/beta hydrolase [Lachnospiraceae bacterium KM106-2]|nr:alpha/beta hydrolase [Lachnospiraceae bacterium KM106-2]
MEEMLVREKRYVNNIPVIVWGAPSDRAYIYVHGKMSYKESAEPFAELAMRKGYQTISFDLPEHGERKDENYPCDIWNGMNDLNQIADYAAERWNSLSLYACSLGAHFALHAYRDRKFQYCMFQSPVLDMNQLIHRMFRWFHLSEDILKEKQVIKTPFHVMTWDYYQYVLSHPIDKWETPTNILYGTRDEMQSRDIIDDFVAKFHSELVIAENSYHGFAKEHDIPIAYSWMETYMR